MELSFLPNGRINRSNFFFRILLLWVPIMLLGIFMRNKYIELKDLIVVSIFFVILNYLLVIQFIKRLRHLNENILKSLISLIPIVSIIFWIILSNKRSDVKELASKSEKNNNFLNIVYLSVFVIVIGLFFKICHYPGATALIYYGLLCILIDIIIYAIDKFKMYAS